VARASDVAASPTAVDVLYPTFDSNVFWRPCCFVVLALAEVLKNQISFLNLRTGILLQLDYRTIAYRTIDLGKQSGCRLLNS
jgi:hypothetical protein